MKAKEYDLKVGEGHHEDYNINGTSLVDRPATKRLFAVFSEEGQKPHETAFKVLDVGEANVQVVSPNGNGFERIISGVWFMPDTNYPREIFNGDEREIIMTSMSKEELAKATKNYMKSYNEYSFNVMHGKETAYGLKTMEMWILDDHTQLSPILKNSIEDLGYTKDTIPLGTVFLTLFVEDEWFFNEYILTQKLKGFSVEGLFQLKDKEVMVTDKSKSYQMFSELGVAQEEGTLITDQGELSISKGKVELDAKEIATGTFTLKSGFQIEVRESLVVDFGFEEVVPTAVVTPTATPKAVVPTATPTPTAEAVVLESPVEKTVDVQAVEPTVVVTAEPEKEAQSEDSTYKEIEALKAKLQELSDSIKDKEALNEKLKGELVKKPITPSNNSTQPRDGYITKVRGGRTFTFKKQ